MIACAGDVPTLEALAATSDPARAAAGPEDPVRQRRRPDAAAGRDASTRTACPHRDFDTLFTVDKPVIFAYHGYPWLIHRLTYRRTNHDNLHVRGYKEEGTTTTPFDMVMMNDLDRFHLVMDVIDRVPSLGSRAASLRQEMVDLRARARAWTREHGETCPRCATGRGPAPSRTGTPRRRRPRSRPTRATGPELSRAGRATCRAIASSSSVGTTRMVTGEEFVLIGRAPSASIRLRSRSSSIPRALSPARASSRTLASCSPTPAVKTTASAPPSTAR